MPVVRKSKSLAVGALHAFLGCTGLHGLQYVAPSGFRNLPERIFWILVVIVSFVWGSWIIYDPVVAWNREPVEV